MEGEGGGRKEDKGRKGYIVKDRRVDLFGNWAHG